MSAGELPVPIFRESFSVQPHRAFNSAELFSRLHKHARESDASPLLRSLFGASEPLPRERVFSAETPRTSLAREQAATANAEVVDELTSSLSSSMQNSAFRSACAALLLERSRENGRSASSGKTSILPALLLYGGLHTSDNAVYMKRLESMISKRVSPLVCSLSSSDGNSAADLLRVLLRRLLLADAVHRAETVMRVENFEANEEHEDKLDIDVDISVPLAKTFASQLNDNFSSVAGRSESDLLRMWFEDRSDAFQTILPGALGLEDKDSKKRGSASRGSGSSSINEKRERICNQIKDHAKDQCIVVIEDPEHFRAHVLTDLLTTLAALCETLRQTGLPAAEERGEAQLLLGHTGVPFAVVFGVCTTREVFLGRLSVRASSTLALTSIHLANATNLIRALQDTLFVHGALPLRLSMTATESLRLRSATYYNSVLQFVASLKSIVQVHHKRLHPSLLRSGADLLDEEVTKSISGSKHRRTWATYKGIEKEDLIDIVSKDGWLKASTLQAMIDEEEENEGNGEAVVNNDEDEEEEEEEEKVLESTRRSWQTMNPLDRPLEPPNPWIISEKDDGSGKLNFSRISILCLPFERLAGRFFKRSRRGVPPQEWIALQQSHSSQTYLDSPLWALCTRVAGWIPDSERDYLILNVPSFLKAKKSGALSKLLSDEPKRRIFARQNPLSTQSPDPCLSTGEKFASFTLDSARNDVYSAAVAKELPFALNPDGSSTPIDVYLPAEESNSDVSHIARCLFALTRHRLGFAAAASCVVAVSKGKFLSTGLATKSPPETAKVNSRDLQDFFDAAQIANLSLPNNCSDIFQQALKEINSLSMPQLTSTLKGLIATLSKGVRPVLSMTAKVSKLKKTSRGKGNLTQDDLDGASAAAAAKRRIQRELGGYLPAGPLDIASAVQGKRRSSSGFRKVDDDGNDEIVEKPIEKTHHKSIVQRGKGKVKPKKRSRIESSDDEKEVKDMEMSNDEQRVEKTSDKDGNDDEKDEDNGEDDDDEEEDEDKEGEDEEEEDHINDDKEEEEYFDDSEPALLQQFPDWIWAITPSALYGRHISQANEVLSFIETPQVNESTLSSAAVITPVPSTSFPKGAKLGPQQRRQMLMSAASASTASAGSSEASSRLLTLAKEKISAWLRSLAADFLRPMTELPLHECVYFSASGSLLRAFSEISPRNILTTTLTRPWVLTRSTAPRETEGSRDLLHSVLPDIVVAFRLYERAKGRLVHLGWWWAEFKGVFLGESKKVSLIKSKFAQKVHAKKEDNVISMEGDDGEMIDEIEGLTAAEGAWKAQGEGADADGIDDSAELEGEAAMNAILGKGPRGSAELYAGHIGKGRHHRSSKSGGFGHGPLEKKDGQGMRQNGSSSAALVRQAPKGTDAERFEALPDAEKALLSRFWRAVEQLRRHGVLSPYTKKGKTDYVEKRLFSICSW